MKLTDREQDLLQALSGTVKSILSSVPGLNQAIAGYDAYKRSVFETANSEIGDAPQNINPENTKDQPRQNLQISCHNLE